MALNSQQNPADENITFVSKTAETALILAIRDNYRKTRYKLDKIIYYFICLTDCNTKDHNTCLTYVLLNKNDLLVTIMYLLNYELRMKAYAILLGQELLVKKQVYNQSTENNSKWKAEIKIMQ